MRFFYSDSNCDLITLQNNIIQIKMYVRELQDNVVISWNETNLRHSRNHALVNGNARLFVWPFLHLLRLAHQCFSRPLNSVAGILARNNRAGLCFFLSLKPFNYLIFNSPEQPTSSVVEYYLRQTLQQFNLNLLIAKNVFWKFHQFKKLRGVPGVDA